MRLLLSAAVVIITGTLFAADPELVSLAPPDAQVMAGVNVEQVMLSPLGQFLVSQSNQLPDKSFQMLVETAGFDPRRDLRELLLAGNGQMPKGSGIVLARGTFDVTKILEAAQAAGATASSYNGVSILQGKKNEPWLAFLDSTIAVAGDEESVRAAIDRKSAPTSIPSALAVEVNRLSNSEDIWFVSIVSPAQLQPKPPAGADSPQTALLSKILKANGGVKFGANLVVTLQALCGNDQDATALAGLLKMGVGSVAQMGDSNKGLAPLAAVLQSLNVSADGKAANISLSVPEALIEQMIRSQHQAKVTTTPPAPPSELEQPAKGEPTRIRLAPEVVKARLLQQSAPVYPPLAKQAHVSGVVRLNAVISIHGTVEDLTVQSGHPLLVPSAMDAVRQWVYKPMLVNGKPVEVATQLEVSFELQP